MPKPIRDGTVCQGRLLEFYDQIYLHLRLNRVDIQLIVYRFLLLFFCGNFFSLHFFQSSFVPMTLTSFLFSFLVISYFNEVYPHPLPKKEKKSKSKSNYNHYNFQGWFFCVCHTQGFEAKEIATNKNDHLAASIFLFKLICTLQQVKLCSS